MAGIGDAFRGGHECAIFTKDDHKVNKCGFDACSLNRGHTNFLKIEEFKERKGPLSHSDKRKRKYVWDCINRTVRVKVSYTSTNRPRTYVGTDIPYPLRDNGGKLFIRYGTGFMNRCLQSVTSEIEKPCPCLDCASCRPHRENSKPLFCKYFVIATATHVIFDTSEAKMAVFEFFFDSEDRKGVECIYGVTVLGDLSSRLNTDTCYVLCVTHNKKLARRLTIISKEYLFAPSHLSQNFLVSHPHGMGKRISFGDVTDGKCLVNHEGDSSTQIMLKTGLLIRISGDMDNASDLIRMLTNSNTNRSENSSATTLRSDGSVAFALPCDIGISGPHGIAVETDIDREADFHWWPKIACDKWWTLSPGTKLATATGQRFTLPHRHSTSIDTSDDNNTDTEIKFQFYIEGVLGTTSSIYVKDNPDEKCFPHRFVCFNYTMASCPGSSGARFYYHSRAGHYADRYVGTHFGRSESGLYNRTGLLNGI